MIFSLDWLKVKTWDQGIWVTMNAFEVEEMGELCHIQMCSCSQFPVQLCKEYIGRVCLYSRKLVWISDKSEQSHSI